MSTGPTLGVGEAKNQRDASNFVEKFREENCLVLSDLARCACPKENASFSASHDFYFPVNQGTLLTEPWNAVLIRAFAKAGVVFLDSEAVLSTGLQQEDVFERADNCIRALWYLGRKSNMALSAARILGEALEERRRSVQDKVDATRVFSECEIWQGFGSLDETFGMSCEA